MNQKTKLCAFFILILFNIFSFWTASSALANTLEPLSICFCNRTLRTIAVDGDFLFIPDQKKVKLTYNSLDSTQCITYVLMNNNNGLQLLYLKMGHEFLSNRYYDHSVSFNYTENLHGVYALLEDPFLARGCYSASPFVSKPQKRLGRAYDFMFYP